MTEELQLLKENNLLLKQILALLQQSTIYETIYS